MAFGLFRRMIDSEGDKMSGYYTKLGEYGVRNEAREFDSYEAAEETLIIEREYWNDETPDDTNSFSIVDFDD